MVVIVISYPSFQINPNFHNYHAYYSGRAGKSGTAITFLTNDDSHNFWELKEMLNKSPVCKIDSIMYDFNFFLAVFALLMLS